MSRRKLTLLFVVLVIAGLAAGSARAVDLTLDIAGSGIGQPLTLTMTGPANESHILIMSMTTGPTITPWITLDVGLELLSFCPFIPGFMGYFDATGNHVINLVTPNDPALHGFNLNFQNCLLDNMGSPILDKSNLYRVTFQTPGTYMSALNALEIPLGAAATALLDDGTVLLAGGLTDVGGSTQCTKALYLYHPNLEAFEEIPTAALPLAQAEMTAHVLNDGRVLLLGGLDDSGKTTGSAYLYDPATRTLSTAGTGKMMKARYQYAAEVLNDGRVIILGGTTDTTDEVTMYESLEKSTEIYDPTANTFTAGPTMSHPRGAFTATKLTDGSVLLAGGASYTILFGIKIPVILDTGRRYVPSAGIGSFGSLKTMTLARAAHSAVRLGNGRVLLISGATGTILNPSITATCEVYNPASQAFSATGGMSTGRVVPGVARLPSGKVFVTGGGVGDLTNYTIIGSSEVYDPAGSWSAGPALSVPRVTAGWMLLPDGSFMAAGGMTGNPSSAVTSVEIYQP